MNVYLYDAILAENKYASLLSRLETRITDLGLNGKIIRLGVMHSVHDAITTEIKNGAKTIVVVGGSKLFNQAVNALAKFSAQSISYRKIPLGYIPINNGLDPLAEILGIGRWEDACDTLAARRIETLDLGQANDTLFLTTAIVPALSATIEIDGNYSIEIAQKGEVVVANLPVGVTLPAEIKSRPNDGRLELFILTKTDNKIFPLAQKSNRASVFDFKKLKILSAAQVTLDRLVKINTPVEISLAKEKINLIVGKNRDFKTF